MTPELGAKLAGRRVVASISGGKDSAALSLWLTEQGIDHDRVFMDTGWEHPKTYEYLRGPLSKVIGPIVEICAPEKMEELIKKKAMFPSRLRRYCTQELKMFPMQAALRGRGDEAVNAVGIRAAESAARARMSEWEWSDGFDCEVWRPLIRWSEEQVIAIHKAHGLAPNPLYLLGATRVGCWPCIHARKSEIALMAKIDPERISKLRVLEAEVTESAWRRWNRPEAVDKRQKQYAAAVAAWEASPESWIDEDGQEQRRGDRPEPAKFTPRAFFHGPSRHGPLPIDQVVAWAMNGKKQGELFEDPAGGCMRWGLCETSE